MNKEIDDEKYNEADKLYNKLGFKSFKQQFQLYQTIDFKFINGSVDLLYKYLSKETYGLEPGQQFTSSSSHWILDLILNPDMYLIEGGISTTDNLRYAQTNNQHCGEVHKSKPYTQLMYLDTNNLYGHTIPQKLPYKNVKFIKEDKFKDQSIVKVQLKHDSKIKRKKQYQIRDKNTNYYQMQIVCINLNILKRQQAKNKINEQLCIRQDNQNVRNRVSYELVFSKQRIQNNQSEIFNNFITLLIIQARIEKYKKTAYIGMQIIDLSN